MSGTAKIKATILSRCTEIYETKLWKPTALRVPVLVSTIAICWALIAVLEYLLWKSQTDNGLLFAPVINDLPLGDTFLYLYFPTLVAVIFSIHWAWIDLETKRMEPYYQLSKETGALGKDSLLLHYPFSFIPLAPLRAFRDRHWPVFWASFAVVLVTWGLVPTQAGIFSIRTVTRTTNTTFSVSTSSMPFEKQATDLSFRYSHSTYGIAVLNEPLLPYMARNYTLAPFKPKDTTSNEVQHKGKYTAPTTMYSLDLICEDASHKADNSRMIFYTSSNGCNATVGLTGNLTIGKTQSQSEVTAVKGYTAKYVGYHSGGWADWYLSPYCPKSANTTFLAAFAKSKARAEDPPQDVTAVYCHPWYWRQTVSATIDRQTKEPLRIDPLGDKTNLPWEIFNATNFEALLNSGTLGVRIRGDYLPTSYIPRYLDTMADTNLTVGVDLQPMVGLALATSDRPLGDYLDWRILSQAYTNAYRLLFARAMVDILSNDLNTSADVTGQQQDISEAVVVEPVFVHTVVGFLAVVSLATISLLILSLTRKRKLQTDPSTIASIMALVADNDLLLSDFADLDCCTEEDVDRVIAQKRYTLVNDETGTRLLDVTCNDVTDDGHGALHMQGRRDSPTSIAKPVRPIEFTLWIAIPFVTLFVALAVTLGVIYSKAYANGLPVPSSNAIVRGILESYIPTAIATLIEPMWVLFNRLLCLLQPLEELQDCNAEAKKSIDMDYSSLPPQLVVFKAFRSKHFVLAAVCAMALLANLLAVAFSGLINQKSFDIQQATTFQPPFDYKIVPINGSIGPDEGDMFGMLETSGAYKGGIGEDQFLVAESNFTRGTPLPSWTDHSWFYLPFFKEQAESGANSSYYEASTRAIGAELDCTELKIGQNFQASIANTSIGAAVSLNVSVPYANGNALCGTTRVIKAGQQTFGSLRPTYTCVDGPSANEVVSKLSPKSNATQQEQEACMGRVIFAWMRHTEGTCPVGKAKLTIDERKALFVQCRPRVITASAKVQVYKNGRLQRAVEHISNTSIFTNSSDGLFSNDVMNIIRQSNLYIFRWSGTSFHNDDFAEDYLNYFIKRGSGSRLIDPSLSAPTFDEAIGPMNKAYSTLFAIWLGLNKRRLFVPSSDSSTSTIDGYLVESKPRIVFSHTMFIISEAILCTYVFVAIWVYARRPGQYLARMPTSIASLIALFAASTAVQDMRGTCHLGKKERAKHLHRLGSKYGFGSFIGRNDGSVHIGIEKCPLVVKPRSRSTWLEQKMPFLRKRSGG